MKLNFGRSELQMERLVAKVEKKEEDHHY